MTEYIGEYYDAEVNGNLMTIAESDGCILHVLTRDEAYDLQEAINAVIGAMPVDIRAKVVTK
jgi:hypothetical protein